MNGLTEQQIWQAFKAGSDEALSYMYRQYANTLYNYGMQMTPKSEVVQDAIQDLFCDLIQSRSRLGETTSIKFYLMGSLRNRLVRTLKYKENDLLFDSLDNTDGTSRSSREGFKIALPTTLSEFNDPFSGETNAAFQEAFNLMPEKQREAILLYYYEDMSYQEISEIMQMTKVKSARALIYRALESLTSLLKVEYLVCLLLTLRF